MILKFPFYTNRNNLLNEIFYSYSYIWHVIAQFGKIFFHAPIHYEAEMKLCVFVCKSVCVRAHAQSKRAKASKFGTEILERIFEKTSRCLFWNLDLEFLEWFLKIFSWILVQNFLLFHDSSHLCKFSIKILKRDFEKTVKWFFSKNIPDYLQGLFKI